MPDNVQLWLWNLDAPGAGSAEDWAVLSAAERARAARFIVPEGRRRFTAGRARLRRTVAAAVGASATGLPLASGANGKPCLREGPEFNLSHSGPFALFGLAAWPIGVDIEQVRPIDPGVANLIFTPAELAEWAAMGRTEAGFYRGWTRKEAVLKANGATLAQIKDFVVSLGHPGLVHGDPAWQIADVAAPKGFAAAVAAPRSGWQPVWQSQ